MRRYDCLAAIAGWMTEELVVANLANTSTEWRALRPHEGNLYFVGMGMVTPYALGLALALPHRPVLALDGDGGILFDLSVLGTLAQSAPRNLCVVVFDNGGYVSTGRSPASRSLTGNGLDLAALARASGVQQVHDVRDVEAFEAAVRAGLKDGAGPTVVIARTGPEQAFVGTSLMDGRENKYRFARHVEATERITILRPSAKEHGEPPKPDPVFAPVAEDAAFGTVLAEGLRENGVDFVIGLPCSGMAAAQAICMGDNTMRYVPVAHEGTGIGICAGAWLGGRKPAALMENLGIYASVYQLLRGHWTFGIPTLIVAEWRGDMGEQEFFGDSGDMTPPVLAATRTEHRVVSRMGDLKPALRDALRWMTMALRPAAVLPTYELTRLKQR
jgi:sulfopyruvate decarboxylase TPP-binding subunit